MGEFLWVLKICGGPCSSRAMAVTVEGHLKRAPEVTTESHLKDAAMQMVEAAQAQTVEAALAQMAEKVPAQTAEKALARATTAQPPPPVTARGEAPAAAVLRLPAQSLMPPYPGGGGSLNSTRWTQPVRHCLSAPKPAASTSPSPNSSLRRPDRARQQHPEESDTWGKW